MSWLGCVRGVDDTKETSNDSCLQLATAKYDQLLLATSWPKLRFATIEFKFQTFSLRFSC